jgi:hypothetical protein
MRMGVPLIIADAIPTSTLFIPIKKMMCGNAIPINPPIIENFIISTVGVIIRPIAVFMQKSKTPPPSVIDPAYIMGSMLPRVTSLEIAGTLPRTTPKVKTKKNADKA